MANFTWRPTKGAKRASKPKVNEAVYGDGYSQRSSNGINNNPGVWSLTFDKINDQTANQIDDFLAAQAGVQAFVWVNPRGQQGNYICKEWNRDCLDEDENTITATFTQIFGG